MKKVLLLTLVLLCCGSLAFAQGSIAVYADDGYGNMLDGNCEIYDWTGVAYQYITLHFVHVADVCVSAVEFQADMTQLSIIQEIGDLSPFPLKIGTFRTGASIGYQAHLMGQIYLGSTTVKKASTYKHLCKYVYVKNNPQPGIRGVTHPLAVDCAYPSHWVHLTGSYAVVSYDFTNCRCPETIPTRESSWGQIKALYE